MTLETTIRRLTKTASQSEKERMRSRMLRQIRGGLLQEEVLPILPSFTSVLNLRAQIMDRIINWKHIPVPIWQRSLRPVAIIAALTLVLRMAPALFIAEPLEASSQNLLLPTKGMVSIMEGAKWKTIEEETPLTRATTIRTLENGSATLVLNNSYSILRMEEHSEVILRESAFDDEDLSPVLRVSYGNVWITSLYPEALFAGTSIILPQGTLAIKKGSVNVFADPNRSIVQVFHGFARILPTGEDPIHLIQGDQLVLLQQGKPQRHLITESVRSGDWVQENLSRDAVHQADVVQQQQLNAQTVAGILPDSAFYILKIASEQLDLGLTISGEARKEKKIQHAKTRLNEAVALLKQGKSDEAKRPLASYREAITALASVSEEDVKKLLADSIISSTGLVADALPHSELFSAKEALMEAAAEASVAEITPSEVDMYLLSDALLQIESILAQGNIAQAMTAFEGIEGVVISVVEDQRLGESIVTKDSLKMVKAILRSIAMSINQAEYQVGKTQELALLKTKIEVLIPPTKGAGDISTIAAASCSFSAQEVSRRANQFLARVWSDHTTPVGRRNATLNELKMLNRLGCPEVMSRILTKVMNKLPVQVRSFAWQALQDTEINP